MRTATWLWLLALTAGCGTKSGKTSSVARLTCVDCSSGTIATNTKLVFSTSWQADCWESTGGGLFSVSSDSGQHETHAPCDQVDHVPSLACVGGECKITPLPQARVDSNERSFEVVVVTPGEYEVRAELARDRKKPASLSYKLAVARPTRLETTCDSRNGLAGIWATLSHDGGTFSMAASVPTMTVGDVKCSPYQHIANDLAQYLFDCPTASRDPIVTVAGADFALSKQTHCQ
jgi:hypothetical protein